MAMWIIDVSLENNEKGIPSIKFDYRPNLKVRL